MISKKEGDMDTLQDEQFWQLYLNDCTNKGLSPRIKDFIVWQEEEGYNEIPEEVYHQAAVDDAKRLLNEPI